YVISLPYVLWRAGTRSVVAALWEIDDRIAMPFMRRFYTLLGAESARDALRLTQLECVGNRLPACALIDTSDPVCWSGFQLYGDGRVGRGGRDHGWHFRVHQQQTGGVRNRAGRARRQDSSNSFFHPGDRGGMDAAADSGS